MARLCTVAGLLAMICVSLLLSSGLRAGENGDKGSGLAAYRAEQSNQKLKVTAEGMNNTGGWSNVLAVVPDTKPPEFKFTQKRPEGPATQAFHRFSVSVTIDAPEKLAHVFLNDAKGRHEVAVRQRP